jgi:tetratricopeptide (TPR) repeat protein
MLADRLEHNLLEDARRQILAREYDSALRCFQTILVDFSFDDAMTLHPQFLSHYGAALAMASGKLAEGRRLCERSIQLEPYEPEHYLNLARIHKRSGDRDAAFRAFDRGLAIRPDHPQLLQERGSLDRRKFLAFRSLHRDHPLNRCLGKLLGAAGLIRSA